MSLSAGTRFGHFEVTGSLGAGGMGEVYRARDTRLGREVALKVLPEKLASDRERLIRFAQEARSASALNHPNIVTIYEVGQAGTLPYIAMELVEGETLRELLKQSGPLPLRRLLGLAAQLADGLAKAHAAGIVHRDLKPENVMVTRDGLAKILDFGLAKLSAGPDFPASEAASMTATGFVMGSVGYMSPEQAAGGPVDYRSDQFLLGLVLYEMATGHRAFDRPTAVQTMSAIIQDDPDPVERANPRVPLPLRWVIERCLSKDPEERYAATRDLARDLRQQREAIAGGEPSTMLPAAESAPTQQSPRGAPSPAEERPRVRLAAVLWTSAIAVALLAGGLAGGLWLAGRVNPVATPLRWKGERMAGGALPVFAPRLAPDGKMLGFVTLVDGMAQAAVMNTVSGDWVVLTRDRSHGPVDRVDWSRDGSRIFYDRVSEASRAVYTVPAVGGAERLLLEDAQAPEALPDGSLLVLRVNAAREFQFVRYWPNSGRQSPEGPPIARDGRGLNFRAFRDGKAVIFFGRLAGNGAPRARRAHCLDLATGNVTPFAPEIPLGPPLALGEDRSSVLGTLAIGDLSEIVRVPRDGTSAQTLLSLTDRPWYLAAGPAGSLYLGLVDDRREILRFSPEGGIPERVATAERGSFFHPVETADGRLFVPSMSAGVRHVLLGPAGDALEPMLATSEPASPPVAMVSATVAALVGTDPSDGAPDIILASLPEGRILRHYDRTKGIVPSAMIAETGGRTLAYAWSGSIWTLDVGSGAVSRLCAGDGVAEDPRDGSLVVQVNARTGVELLRVRPDGSQAPIPVAPGDLSLTTTPLGGRAVSADGRVVLTVTAGSWPYSAPGILDPATGRLERVPLKFEGDVGPTVWGTDGGLLGLGSGRRTELWRLSPTLPGAVR